LKSPQSTTPPPLQPAYAAHDAGCRDMRQGHIQHIAAQHSTSHYSRKRNIKFRKGLIGRLMGKCSGREGVVEG
jgi:hypothetical protein